jgi:hypothetical protein
MEYIDENQKNWFNVIKDLVETTFQLSYVKLSTFFMDMTIKTNQFMPYYGYE